MPRLFQVPLLPNPYFVGRARELRLLRRRRLDLDLSVRRQALVGHAGVGKSQLAAEYAHSARGDFEVSWWIRAEGATTLVDDLVALADALELPTAPGSDAAARLRRLDHWLENTRLRWLLVFDNAEDPDTLSPFLATAGVGRVIVTSRRSGWDRIATEIPIRPLSLSVAVRFLARRTARRADPHMQAVAEKLDGLCLALEHVGAFVRETRMPMRDFAHLLDRHGFSAADGPVEGHPEPLGAV
ncbi:MAG: NB-ARC domain-containing protein, partial [Solirubrobacteraceae bacterium]